MNLYLKKLDAEIVRLRQEIAIRQVEIQRCEDARLTIMGLESREENDVAAGLLNGTPVDRPALIVRQAGTGGEDGSASQAAKLGLNRSGNKRGLNQKRYLGESTRFRGRIRELLHDAPEPMASREIGNHLGLPAGEKARKAMSNALYQMRMHGMVHRDPDDKRYSLVPPQQRLGGQPGTG